MVPEEDLPAHVMRFVAENIDTVPELETLLMMSQSPDRPWLIADVASRNYISEQRAAAILAALQRRGLVSAEDAPPRFRFNPMSDEIAALVADLARCYQTNIARIATFIHSKPSASIKEFARAFDLKKEK
jgi:hypothetical protein